MSRAIQRYQARKDGDESEFGFTLIELLIVIVVLGILAAVTVFALSSTTSKSAQAACNADAATVNTALTTYVANMTSTTAAPTGTSSGTLVTAGYLQSWPSNTSHYTISILASTTTPVTYSVQVTGNVGTTPVAQTWTPGSAACSSTYVS